MKLLKFFADWCAPCRKQTELLKDFTDCEVESLNVEDDNNQELVDQYNIMSLPTMIIVDENNIVKSRFVGLTDVNKIKEELNKE